MISADGWKSAETHQLAGLPLAVRSPAGVNVCSGGRAVWRFAVATDDDTLNRTTGRLAVYGARRRAYEVAATAALDIDPTLRPMARP